MSSISISLKFLRATVFILTCNPAFVAAFKPANTLFKSPQRVTCLNFSGSKVSKETLIRLTPQSTSSWANLDSWLPFVVKVKSSSAPESKWRLMACIKLMILRRTRGSPPVKRSCLTPFRMNAEHKRSNSSSDRTSFFGKKFMSSDMQYTQRKSHRSVTDIRK